MKPRLVRAPLTDEDMWIRKLIAWRIAPSILGAANYRYALVAADRRDAELMYRQSWQYPGAAVITVDCGDHRMTHVIVGRLERERYERMRAAGDIT